MEPRKLVFKDKSTLTNRQNYSLVILKPYDMTLLTPV